PLLFLCCSATHHDLYSFPTRRSSDLVSHRWFDIQPNAANRRSLLWILCRSHATAAGPVRTLSDTGHSRATELDTGGLCSDRVRTDRKSTRLNSSHVSISYAVFCLKKK